MTRAEGLEGGVQDGLDTGGKVVDGVLVKST
jgi:hypothetical protein